MDKFKNVALSLAVIAGVTGLVFGATQAVWTSQADNPNNFVKAGEVGIELTGEGPDRIGDGPATEPFFRVDGMVPGQSETAYIAVANGGNTSITFDLDLVNRNVDGTPGLDRVLNYRVRQVADMGVLSQNFQNWFTDGGRDYSLWVPTGNTGTVDWVSLADGATLYDWYTGNLPGDTNEMGSSIPMPPNYVAVYEVEIQLDENAGNQYQGNLYEIDVLATGTSAANVELVQSTTQNYSAGGWAGWSCPDDLRAVGGFVENIATANEGLAVPGVTVGGSTYPTYPHYTFNEGSGETGYVAQSAEAGNGYINVYCAEL